MIGKGFGPASFGSAFSLAAAGGVRTFGLRRPDQGLACLALGFGSGDDGGTHQAASSPDEEIATMAGLTTPSRSSVTP